MIKQKLSLDDNSACLEYLNSGSGVLDVAGGNGWASFSLALHGIKSTVVDPSPAVGCLPARYRKFLRRAIQGKNLEISVMLEIPVNKKSSSIPIIFGMTLILM